MQVLSAHLIDPSISAELEGLLITPVPPRERRVIGCVQESKPFTGYTVWMLITQKTRA
jgi:hypothetical protein